MSAIHERQFALEQRRRLEVIEQQARQITERNLTRFQQTLKDLANKGLQGYVPAESAEIGRQIINIRELLKTNPSGARDASLRLEHSVYKLPHLAVQVYNDIQEAEQRAYEEMQRVEAEAQQQERAALVSVWQAELSRWDDKLARNLAMKELSIARDRLLSKNAETSAEDIKRELALIKQLADERATVKRQTAVQNSHEKADKDMGRQLLADINSAKLPRERLKKIIARIDQLSLKNGASFDDITQISQDVDSAITDEVVRREVVRAVYISLKEAGFVVQQPDLIQEADKDEVVIRASRPAGNNAFFIVELNGRMTYKFDNYKGQTCQKDMAQVLPKLSEVYGVNLSDARVLWSNPDDIDAEMKPIPTQSMHKK